MKGGDRLKLFKNFDPWAFGMAIRPLPEYKKRLAVRMVVRDLDANQRAALYRKLEQIRRRRK